MRGRTSSSKEYVIRLWYLLLLGPISMSRLPRPLTSGPSYFICIGIFPADTSNTFLLLGPVLASRDESCQAYGRELHLKRFRPILPRALVRPLCLRSHRTIEGKHPFLKLYFYSLLIDSFLLWYGLNGNGNAVPVAWPPVMPAVPTSGVQRLSGHPARGEHHQAHPTPPHRLDLGLPPLLAR